MRSTTRGRPAVPTRRKAPSTSATSSASWRGGPFDVDKICELILATRHEAEPEDADAALVVDIDLGVLGAEAHRYDLYAGDIRREYAHVEEQAYREGRAAVLRGFLGRRRIYHTRHFRKLLEERARANMLRELEGLEDPGSEH